VSDLLPDKVDSLCSTFSLCGLAVKFFSAIKQRAVFCSKWVFVYYLQAAKVVLIALSYSRREICGQISVVVKFNFYYLCCAKEFCPDDNPYVIAGIYPFRSVFSICAMCVCVFGWQEIDEVDLPITPLLFVVHLINRFDVAYNVQVDFWYDFIGACSLYIQLYSPEYTLAENININSNIYKIKIEIY